MTFGQPHEHNICEGPLGESMHELYESSSKHKGFIIFFKEFWPLWRQMTFEFLSWFFEYIFEFDQEVTLKIRPLGSKVTWISSVYFSESKCTNKIILAPSLDYFYDFCKFGPEVTPKIWPFLTFEIKGHLDLFSIFFWV